VHLASRRPLLFSLCSFQSIRRQELHVAEGERRAMVAWVVGVVQHGDTRAVVQPPPEHRSDLHPTGPPRPVGGVEPIANSMHRGVPPLCDRLLDDSALGRLADTCQTQLPPGADLDEGEQEGEDDGRRQGGKVGGILVGLQSLTGGSEAVDARVARQICQSTFAAVDARGERLGVDRIPAAISRAVDEEREINLRGAVPARAARPSASWDDGSVGGTALTGECPQLFSAGLPQV
jgi:hypothetical protein